MIDFEALVLHALGELEGRSAEEVDRHVLACGPCAAKLEWLLRIPPVVRDVVRSGEAAFPVTATLAEHLRAAGLISRSYELEPDRPVPCSVETADVYSLTTLVADLRDVEQVDLVVTLPFGPLRMIDVPFDRARGVVSWVTQSSRLRTLPSARVTIELFSVGAGGERKLGRYLLDHTAWAGG